MVLKFYAFCEFVHTNDKLPNNYRTPNDRKKFTQINWWLVSDFATMQNYSYQLWKYRHILFQLSHTHTPTHTHKAKKKKTITFQNGRTHSNDSISHIFFSTFSFRACFSYFISYNFMLCYLWGDLTLRRTPVSCSLKINVLLNDFVCVLVCVLAACVYVAMPFKYH